MKIPSEWEDNLKIHIVTPYMLGAVIYSYNKRAKNMRDSERWFRWSDGNISKKYRKKKEFYYSRKDVLLGFESPCSVHIVERKDYRDWDIVEYFKEYYLYYKVGDYTFHSPITNPKLYELPVVNIGDLQTRGLPTNQLLSLRNCDRIYRGLKNGSLKYICDAA